MEQIKTEIATVVYLVRGDTMYLSKKKTNVHMSDGKDLKKSAVWNGYGGKSEKTDTSILHTAVRELKEESSVDAKEGDLVNVGELNFYWPGNETANANMCVHFYTLKSWVGDPVETETMEAP
jgi:8-oxo-dGTP pyrophosphatase MutT (NUDIX family)